MVILLFAHITIFLITTSKMGENTINDLFTKIDGLKGDNSVDIIIGGPPCQAYSLVGRAVKSDNMVGDPRNYLYKLYIEVLKKYTPTMFVFENVPGLVVGGNSLADYLLCS